MKTSTHRHYFRRHYSRPVTWISLLLLAAMLMLAACGGGAGDSASTGESATPAQEPSSNSARVAPTALVARFGAPTSVIDLTKVAERAEDGTPEPDGNPDLALGENGYGRLCAECHGAAGEGVAGEGETIIGMTLEYGAFDDLLRTGGGNGNEHIFGPTKISDDGIRALLAFVQSLSTQ
ncbi:MAG: cytochrome c [Caldilineaceae bacterium]|nr:cytochrome c [Caldilineaceae bacterium]